MELGRGSEAGGREGGQDGEGTFEGGEAGKDLWEGAAAVREDLYLQVGASRWVNTTLT